MVVYIYSINHMLDVLITISMRSDKYESKCFNKWNLKKKKNNFLELRKRNLNRKLWMLLIKSHKMELMENNFIFFYISKKLWANSVKLKVWKINLKKSLVFSKSLNIKHYNF